MNVLLIEDDEDTALALEMLLGSSGLRLRWARDGHQALAMLTSRSSPNVDVIVLDLGLPDYSATDLMHEIRKLECVPSVVVYSATSDRILRETAARIGAAAAIRKPCDRATLIRTIEEAVRPAEGFQHA